MANALDLEEQLVQDYYLTGAQYDYLCRRLKERLTLREKPIALA